MNFGKFTPWNEWKDHLDGTEHYQFRFENGYGASVIRGPYSYGGPQGLYELAVLRKRRKYWEITYDTTLTNDVLGNLEVDDVVKALEDISRLADVTDDDFDDLENILDAAFTRWLDRHPEYKPNFYTLTDTETFNKGGDPID